MDLFEAQKQYLVECSVTILVDHGLGINQEERVTDPQEILMVNLNRMLLKNVNSLELCTSLRICLLPDNFVTNISALRNCVHLIKLDLKGNQITHLPDSSFWNSLNQLQFLCLHDNNICTRKDIHGLSGCKNLTALTLYSTPLSLKGNYRHCMVNSIWSLKALDNYVISDEETIENWCLPPKFKILNSNFHVNLYPTSKLGSFVWEMNNIRHLISKINRIQALYCPTLIIQRLIRGYLTRKRLGLVQVVPRGRRLRIQCVDKFSPRSKESQAVNREKNMAVERLFENVLNLVKTENPKVKVLQVEPYGTTLHNSNIVTPNQTNHMEALKEHSCEELEKTSFRVVGFRAFIHLVQPVNCMLLSRHHSGRDIRKAIRHFHSLRSEVPERSLPHPPTKKAEKRLMARCHGSISLAPFQMIERAYQARALAEAQRRKAELVSQVQTEREEAKELRQVLVAAQRNELIQERHREQAQMVDALEHRRASRDRQVQAVREKYARFREEKKQLELERAQAMAFTEQHCSLTKAINRHSTKQRLKEAQDERSDMVYSSKVLAMSHKKLIHAYLENRKHRARTDGILSLLSRKTYLASTHNYHVLQTQTPVASLRASQQTSLVEQPILVNQTE